MPDALTLSLLLSSVVAAEGAPSVVVLSQPKVAAYAQVLSGFSRTHRGVSEEVDVDDSAAVATAVGSTAQVIVAVGTRAFEVAKAKANGATIVATALFGTETGGRADITAVPMETRSSDALSLLKALAPTVRNVVAFYPAANAALASDARAAAAAAGLAVDFRPVTDAASFQAQFAGNVAGHDAVWMLPDTRLAKVEVFEMVARECLTRGLPAVGFHEGMTAAGALAAVAVDYQALGREAAQLTMDLVAKPRTERAGTPFRFPPGKPSVNEKTFAALRLTGKPPPGVRVVR